MKRETILTGCLIGGALGDSLGLPCEGLSATRIRKWWKSTWKQRLVFGKGMFSDDTEHAAMTARALAMHPDDTDAFRNALAKSLRWWFAAVPAGIGLATAKSCIRLWLGISPERSGVHSAGNGAAMRAAVIGAFHANDPGKRQAFTDASSHITHRDSRALEAARMVAEAAACASQSIIDARTILDRLENVIADGVCRQRLDALRIALENETDVPVFASSFGKPGKVSGYAPDSAAVALFAWLRHRHDFATILTEAIACGGDTDTIAAIAGGIAGCETPPSQMPAEWKAIADWPITLEKLQALTQAMTGNRHIPYLSAPWPLSLLRNFLFLLIILIHALRRLLPPY